MVNRIQHHRAHVAAVIAEHGLAGPTVGVAFDGTGYGDDGTVWGGEFFFCEGNRFERRGHIESVRLIGGDASARNASVTACCFLREAVCRGYLEEEEVRQLGFGREGYGTVWAALEYGIHTVASSSMGRLFDAAAAILGICGYNSYEGECPQRLQDCAQRLADGEGLKSGRRISAPSEPGGYLQCVIREDSGWIADTVSLVAELARQWLRWNAELDGKCVEEVRSRLAFAFHEAIARMTAELCVRIAGGRVHQAALGGGTMYNGLLLQLLFPLLEEKGLQAYVNELVPSGDGGLAYGQLYLSALEEDRREGE